MIPQKGDETMVKKQFIQDMLSCLQTHLEQYPASQARDMVKFIFQGMLGVGHLLAAPETVERYIALEMQEQAPVIEEALTDALSPFWCRLNLRRALAERLSPRQIANVMFASQPEFAFTRADVRDVCQLVAEERPLPALLDEIAQIEDECWLPSHSEIYREMYCPAYRVVAADWVPLLPILCMIAQKEASGKRILVTIDGPCASGKTTLAKKLAQAMDASIVHTDDFVVPHAQKTSERLAIPGGNCDWERLCREVIVPWKEGKRPQYQRYDCMQDCLLPPETVTADRVLILEGSYSNLPAIQRHADLRLFVDTAKEVWMERLRQRESPQSLQQFYQRWIPLEDAYFKAYGLPDQNCILIHA